MGALAKAAQGCQTLKALSKERISGTTLPCTPVADPAFAAHPAQHPQHLCPHARQHSHGLASRVRHLRTAQAHVAGVSPQPPGPSSAYRCSTLSIRCTRHHS